MLSRAICLLLLTGLWLDGSLLWAASPQQTTTEAASALPRLVRFSGMVKDLNGNPLTGVVGITFALYSEQTGGAALWLETQNVTADSNGHYVALLGTTKPDGLPADLFNSEQARWVGVQVSGQAEQPRVLLVSAPYALKAGDAETIGGLPPSAFMLASHETASKSPSEPASARADKNSVPPANPDVTGKGTVDFIPMWDTTSDIINSLIFQKTSEIGINTTTPAALLDVNGKTDIRDTLTLFPKSTDSTLTVNGTNFKIDQTGKVTFITGQTFPGTGTITGVTTASGSGLSGGGTSGTLKLSLTNTCAANQVLEWSGTAWACATPSGSGTITGVTAGTDLTGGGTSGNVTLNLNTAKVPLLAAANTFVGNQTVTGNLTASGTVTASILDATSANVTSFVGINSTVALPLTSSTSNLNATSIMGTASTTTGEAWGVEGLTQSSGPAAFGVAGIAASSTGDPIGVYGQTGSSDGVGVFGQNGTAESGTGNVTFSQGFTGGVWGDGGTVSHEIGVLGTVDDGYAGFFVNNTAGRYSIWVQNTDVGVPFIAGYGPNVGSLSDFCMIDHSGDLSCTGTKNAVVPIDGGKRTVAMSAIESPQNWFEDAGPGQLSGGKTMVVLDPDYVQTVNTSLEYQVFLTPYGDCKGLYVTNRTPTSFEVHELGAGTANVSFGYRVMALRRNYENVRFADHTHDTDAMRQMSGRAKPGRSRSHSHKLQNSPVLVRATSVAPAPTTKASK
jgi:hypothetical protein